MAIPYDLLNVFLKVLFHNSPQLLICNILLTVPSFKFLLWFFLLCELFEVFESICIDALNIQTYGDLKLYIFVIIIIDF